MARKVTARNFSKGVTISFAGLPIEMVGDLAQPLQTGSAKKEDFVSVSPNDPTRKLRRIYWDDVTKEEIAGDRIQKAKEMDDGSLQPIAVEAIKAAKKSELPERRLELTVFKREDIVGILVPGEKRYVFNPSSNTGGYGVTQRLLREHPEYVLLGRINLGARSNEKLMEVTLGLNGNLMVSELSWFEDVNEFDVATWECPDKTFSMFEQIIAGNLADYHEEEWKKESRGRLAQLVVGGESVLVESLTAAKNEDDLASLLEATLAQMEAIKAS